MIYTHSYQEVQNMRGGGFTLLVIGVVLLIVGLVNHYAIHANPIAHTSTIVLGVGVVAAVIGAVLALFLGRSKQA